MIRFEQPWFFLLFGVILLWLLKTGLFRPAPRLAFSSLALLSQLSRSLKTRGSWLPKTLRTLGLCLLVLVLAGPVWEEQRLSLEPSYFDILLLVDNSSSMADHALDERSSSLSVVMRNLQRLFRERPDDRVGLVEFARYPMLRCPLTSNHESVFVRFSECVPQGSAEDGTAIGAALAEAARIFTDLRSHSQANSVVILVTDGEENRYTIDPWEAGLLLKSLGVRVYPVAVASLENPQGAGKVDSFHQALAGLTNGVAARAHTAEDLERVMQSIHEREQAPLQGIPRTTRTEFNAWILLPAVLLIVLGFFLSETVFLRIP